MYLASHVTYDQYIVNFWKIEKQTVKESQFYR